MAQEVAPKYVNVLLSGLLSGGLLLALVLLILPWWFLVVTQVYTQTVATLWRWFRGRPEVASLLTLLILPFCVFLNLFRVIYYTSTNLKDSFTKGILSLGIRTIPVSWVSILYLWLALGTISSLAFLARASGQIPNLTINLILSLIGMYGGLILALILFQYEESEEDIFEDVPQIQNILDLLKNHKGHDLNFNNVYELAKRTRKRIGSRKILKTHYLYPEAHLTYILLGGMAGISPWLWDMLFEWVPIQSFLNLGGSPNFLNILVAGGTMGILCSVVFQFMSIKMCRRK